MTDLTPRMSDVRINLSLIARWGPAGHLDDDAFRALTALVSYIAGDLCWTYTPPSDGSLKDDDALLCKIAMMDRRRWTRIRPVVAEFFTISAGRWWLKEDWIEIDERPGRFAIPSVIAARVAAREGKRCTYCGGTEGPFDFDHIFPVSRGGTNDPSNLTLACASCNRSKGAKTLREWICR